MRVKVNDGYAVLWDDRQGHQGETLDADDETGQRWVAGGWATEVEPEGSMHRTTKKAPAKRPT